MKTDLVPGDLVRSLMSKNLDTSISLTKSPGAATPDNPQTAEFYTSQVGLVVALTHVGGKYSDDEEALILCGGGIGWNLTLNMERVTT